MPGASTRLDRTIATITLRRRPALLPTLGGALAEHAFLPVDYCENMKFTVDLCESRCAEMLNAALYPVVCASGLLASDRVVVSSLPTEAINPHAKNRIGMAAV